MSKMFKCSNLHDLCLTVRPCPKCKSDPDMMAWYIRGVANKLNYALVCPKCGYRLKQPYKFRSYIKAIKFWNEDNNDQ